MGAQRFRRGIIPCKLCLRQCGMDFFVADVVQQHSWPALAAFQLGHEMVQALWDIRWDVAVTQGAAGV